MLLRVSSVFIILVLFVIIPWTNACSCDPDETRQEKCQRTDFTFLGRGFFAGIRRIGFYDYIRYCFSIERIFKDRTFALTNPCVYTPVQFSLCGIRFNPWRRYIVSGRHTRSGNIVGACEWNERWSEVPFGIKIQLFTQPNWCSA